MANSEVKKAADVVKIRGIITTAFKGTGKFDKEDKLHVSIKVSAEERAKLREACKDCYKGKGSFIPKWFTDDKTEYINFKSNYDIPALYGKDGQRVESSIEDMLADYGGITGSEVIVSIIVKDGAIYPRGIAFRELKTVDLASMFEDDELPFD